MEWFLLIWCFIMMIQEVHTAFSRWRRRISRTFGRQTSSFVAFQSSPKPSNLSTNSYIFHMSSSLTPASAIIQGKRRFLERCQKNRGHYEQVFSKIKQVLNDIDAFIRNSLVSNISVAEEYGKPSPIRSQVIILLPFFLISEFWINKFD